MHIRVPGLMLLSPVLLLPACASRPPAGGGAITPVAVHGGVKGQGHRFLMTQNGKRMSADDFDAWMKARGVRIARGAQPGKGPGRLVSKEGKRR